MRGIPGYSQIAEIPPGNRFSGPLIGSINGLSIRLRSPAVQIAETKKPNLDKSESKMSPDEEGIETKTALHHFKGKKFCGIEDES